MRKQRHTDPIVAATEEGETRYSFLTGDGEAELKHVWNKHESTTPYCQCGDHKHTVWLETDAPVEHATHKLNGSTKYIVVCSKVCRDPEFYGGKSPIVVLDGKGGFEPAKGVKIKGRWNVVFKEHEPIETAWCPCGKKHNHRTWFETDGEVEIVS